MLIGRSPGKIILSGEHAILAGCPALVMATTPLVECSLRKNTSGNVLLSLPGRTPLQMNSEDVITRAQAVRERHKDALPPESPEDVLFAAVHHSAPDWSGAINFTTSLPIGSGMGASAAFILSLLKALKPKASPEDLYNEALHLEHLQHGTSSGIDVWTCLHGGAWWIGPQERISLTLPALPDFHVYHTGTPTASTGECVMQVKRRFPKGHEIWSKFSKVIHQTRDALEQADAAAWSRAIRENHQMLCQIGVVPESVQQAICRIEENGGAAKVCGAGSVSGDAAGIVLVRDADPATIPEHWSDIDAGICTVDCSE